MLAPKALPLTFAPAGLKIVKLRGLTLVRSFNSALNDVEARVFMDTNRTVLQGIVPIVSLTSNASSPNRLVPVTVKPGMLGCVLTAPSHTLPWLPSGKGTKVVPFHVNAVTVIDAPPLLVSKETRKSPGVRRANCGQAGLAGLVEGSAWLNS